MTIDSRSLSIKILNKFDEENKNFQELRNYFFLKYQLEPIIKYKVMAITNDIIRLKGRLDMLIISVSKRKIKQINLKILNILRLGFYEILYEKNTPNYASVNSLVIITKKLINKKAGGFVNAILRNLIRERKENANFLDKFKNSLMWNSFPIWLQKKWKNEYGSKDFLKLISFFNKKQNNFVRLNSCAINNKMMIGSEVAEIALPLSFESQKRKIQNNPNNQLFYLDASKSRITYAYGILMEKGDRLMYSDYYKSRDYYAKSLDLFVISRNYLFNALQIKYENFVQKMRNKEEIAFEKEDIDYLYWLSGSLAGSIQASQGDPQYLIDLPNIKWLLENAITVDPNWENGTLSAAMMSVYLNDLSGDKNAQKTALSYFDLAEKQSNGLNASIYVTLAENYAVSKQDKKLFIELLDKAINIDVNKDKSLKQSNKLSQSRAKWLKSRVDDLFYM